MKDVIDLLLLFFVLPVVLIICIVLLVVLTITIGYTIGYIYDAFIGRTFLKLSYYVGKKFPSINKNRCFIKVHKILQDKELYLRYETPLCVYCFSYTGISFLAYIIPLPNKNEIESFIIASILYITLYFIGMFRRYRNDKCHYRYILDSNLSFLKLSFVPIGFIFTVCGFAFTITGMKIQEFPVETFYEIIKNFVNYSKDMNVIPLFLNLILVSIMLLILLYIISLPVQAVSYFIILSIKYFLKYKDPYKKLLIKCEKVVQHFW